MEARFVSALNHPHICALFDVGEQDGVAFLVMEFLEGQTLEDRINGVPLPADELLRYAVQIIDALDHAHQAQVTHRDLKPSNVMLTGTGAKLLDFGLARRPSSDNAAVESTVSDPSRRLTEEGSIIGTLRYMAPEQLEGSHADARTDIFAFGALLFEMATGRKAFEGTSQASLIASILTASPPPISEARYGGPSDHLPLAIDHIVDRCLAKKPGDRWQTTRDVKLELEWAATGHTHPPAARARPSRRRAILAVLTGVAIAGALPASSA